MVIIHVIAVDRDNIVLLRHDYSVSEEAWSLDRVAATDLAIASAKKAALAADEFTQYRIVNFQLGSIDIATSLSRRILGKTLPLLVVLLLVSACGSPTAPTVPTNPPKYCPNVSTNCWFKNP